MSAQTLSQSTASAQSNTAARIIVSLVLSAVSGVMLTAAFAPYNAWPLIFVAFIPLIIAQYRVMPAKLSSLISAVMIAVWMYLYFGPSFFPGGIMLALPAIGFIINLLADKRLRGFHEQTHYRWFILNGVFSWVGFEMIRTFIPGIATWGFVNYTLWSQAWLIQPISIFSIYGLSLLIIPIHFAYNSVWLLFEGNWNNPPAWSIYALPAIEFVMGLAIIIFRDRQPKNN